MATFDLFVGLLFSFRRANIDDLFLLPHLPPGRLWSYSLSHATCLEANLNIRPIIPPRFLMYK
jgi:hypothetical protein